MARQAEVIMDTCTWCFVVDKKNEPGLIPVPVTFTRFDNGGFSFTYDPDANETETLAHACREHAEIVLESLAEMATEIEDNIVNKVEEEEKGDLPVLDPEDLDQVIDGDLPEDGTDLGMDEDDEKAVRGHITPKPDGKKVGVSNPKPPLTADNAREGFEPDMSSPDKEERVAIRDYYKLRGYGMGALKGINSPGDRGAVNSKLLADWRSADEYFIWKDTDVMPSEQPANKRPVRA